MIETPIYDEMVRTLRDRSGDGWPTDDPDMPPDVPEAVRCRTAAAVGVGQRSRPGGASGRSLFARRVVAAGEQHGQDGGSGWCTVIGGGELIIDRCLTSGALALRSMWVDASTLPYSDHRALGGKITIVGDGSTRR